MFNQELLRWKLKQMMSLLIWVWSVRDNETWEAVGQRLSSSLQAGSCYQFRIFLSRSEEYFSYNRTTDKNEFFTKPIKLRIWGGNSKCDRGQLLAESKLVNGETWKESTFVLPPKENYTYIVLEAFYKTPSLFPYNGNILVDNTYDIILKDNCDNKIILDMCLEPKEQEIAEEIPKKTKPIDTSGTAAGHQKDQRSEIKVLSVKG